MPNKPLKSKGGRPKKENKKLRVAFALSPEMKDKVEQLARLNKSSLSSIVETLLQQAPDDFRVVPKRSYNRGKKGKEQSSIN